MFKPTNTKHVGPTRDYLFRVPWTNINTIAMIWQTVLESFEKNSNHFGVIFWSQPLLFTYGTVYKCRYLYSSNEVNAEVFSCFRNTAVLSDTPSCMPKGPSRMCVNPLDVHIFVKTKYILMLSHDFTRSYLSLLLQHIAWYCHVHSRCINVHTASLYCSSYHVFWLCKETSE